MSIRRIVVDGQPVAYNDGDSVATAILRGGEHPKFGGTLCLGGDCPNCSADVDGVPYVRTCQTPATPGLVVRRHPSTGNPSFPNVAQADITKTPLGDVVGVTRTEVDVVVIGGGFGGQHRTGWTGKRSRSASGAPF